MIRDRNITTCYSFTLKMQEASPLKRNSQTPAIALLLFSSAAMASGTIEMPPQKERLASRQACFDFLRDSAAEDAKSVKPETVDADGSRHSVTLEPKSKGIERQGRDRARYAARIWYGNGRPDPERQQIVYRASWEEHSFECRGRTLITQRSNGYTLESFEPMPGAAH